MKTVQNITLNKHETICLWSKYGIASAIILISAVVYVCMYVCMHVCMYVSTVKLPGNSLKPPDDKSQTPQLNGIVQRCLMTKILVFCFVSVCFVCCWFFVVVFVWFSCCFVFLGVFLLLFFLLFCFCF